MPTRKQVTGAMAKSMRDFGYPDVTDQMADEIMAAYIAGDDLPHGVIGMFLEKQMDELVENGVDLAALD